MIEITVCEKKKDPTCMPTYKVDKLLQNIFFTMYIGSGRSELSSDHKHNDTIKVVDKFHSQFMLNRK